MSGKEEAAPGSGGCGDVCAGGSDNRVTRVPGQLSGGRRTYWRSASWSASRSMLPPLNPDSEKDGSDFNGNGDGPGWKGTGPLTPRSRKGRSCLPPLQPLSIARRSLDEWPKAGSDDIGEWPCPTTPSGRDLNLNGERLKLDLSNIQKNVDRNAGLVKREKIAFFDKECSKVVEHVYVGGDAVARDKDILRKHGISHILNCVGFVCPEYFKSDFQYRTLWLQDSPTEDITSILYDVFDYFEDVREQGGRVFVHCCQGVSRSTSLVIAYLMWREGQSFDDAFQYVKAARGIADPNMGFACQLLQCQKRVHAVPLSPSSLLRMYRIAPHSLYDPLHLVPKMLNNPSPSCLDSRGAFIVHIPSAIYVWVGKKCETMMEKEARGSVCQIVRYEKVQGPIGVFREGEEPSYFWDAFSNLLPLMDLSSCGVDSIQSTKNCPGERKVDSYNVDFEIFQKATLGGIFPPFGSSENENVVCLPARQSCWNVLRRKFASGSMKDFVSASEYGVCKVYLDSSPATVDNPNRESYSLTNSSSSSRPSSVCSISSFTSSASSSSPQYLSPDSFSSDPNIISTNLSDPPASSPLAGTDSDLTSSALRNLSNMSIGPSKISPQSISTSSKFIDVNFSSHSGSRSNFSPSKKLSLSVAERRGSLSKFVKLPAVDGDMRNRSSSSSGISSEQADGADTVMNHLSVELHNCLVETDHGQGSERYCGDPSIKHSNKSKESSLLGGENEGLVNGVMHGSSSCRHLMQPAVYQWPTMHKISSDSNSLDSRSAYVCITSSKGSKDVGHKTLYIWLGNNFNHNKDGIQFGSTGNVENAAEIDWIQVSAGILSDMGLPTDCNIEIIKENEEPAEFLSILSSM
ncbi:hypothetical protein Leryth_008264 [Lithospermum erythrorhizon]|nr:hypothetical protein Leryth_008264 [Lithospermum erythrorhizon]